MPLAHASGFLVQQLLKQRAVLAIKSVEFVLVTIPGPASYRLGPPQLRYGDSVSLRLSGY